MMLSEWVRGARPAVSGGVSGRIVCGGEGKGSDAELDIASILPSSRAAGLFPSRCSFDLGDAVDDWLTAFAATVRAGDARFKLEELALRVSLTRFGLVDMGAVLDLAGFTSSASSMAVSVMGCGFRACATARGPAHLGSIGRATLARTKLDKTVTGKVFSLIFSWRPTSARPKTMCCTLL